MTATEQSEPTRAEGAATEESPAEAMTPSVTNDPISSAGAITIPQYEAIDVPYAELEGYRNRVLLGANGYGDTPDEWRRATQHTSGFIREAAYYLLARPPAAQDEGLFRQGLKDFDKSVQAVAAYGLYVLGDESMLIVLAEIAQQDVNVSTSATRAAGLLATLGEPSAFGAIENALASDLEHIRLFAIQNLMPFVALQGAVYSADGKTIDVWRLYAQAIDDENAQVRSVAVQQLRELDAPEAVELLKQLSGE